MILHMDIDAFFASVEKLLVPALVKKPVAVGSGCIASCCYVARRYGLCAGMSLANARRRCPGLVVLPGRQPVYKAFAERIWEIARRYSPAVEKHLDDAYLDLTGTDRLHGGPERVARLLRQDVRRETRLAVTVGVAPSRAVARLAGKSVKPDGCRVIHLREVREFLDPLPVGQIPGVGPKTRELFEKLNITTVAELKALSLDQLASLFHGSRRLAGCIYERARGRDTVAVSPREVPATISRRTTFHKETADPEEIRGMLFYLCERAMKAMRELGLAARSAAVVIHYADFAHAESRARVARPVDTARGLFETAWSLFERARTRRVAVRLVGVELSRLAPADTEGLPLFEYLGAGSDATSHETGGATGAREERLAACLDDVRGRFGFGSVVSGPSISLIDPAKGKLERDRNGFVLRTPCLTK